MTNTKDESVQQAINDLAMVRRAIDRLGSDEGTSVESARTASNANLMLHIIALGCCGLLVVMELVLYPYGATGQLMLSKDVPDFGRLGLIDVATFLPLLIGAIYFIVWRAARRSEEDLPHYVARNFKYLRNLSFVADLFVKFVVFMLLVEARRPEWIAPVLTLFTADYLLQGRFFVLPIRISMSLGIACIVQAGLQYAGGSPSLVWPLVVFFAVAAISTSFVLARRPRATEAVTA